MYPVLVGSPHRFLTWLTDRGLPTRSAQMTKDEVDVAWEGFDDLEAAWQTEQDQLAGTDGE